MFFKKRKAFYTCDEIKEMLIAYHQKGNISAYYNDQIGSFFEHGVANRGKNHKFSL